METICIEGYRPGALGRVTEMHAAYYATKWGFGLYFERKVAREMAEFLGRFDAAKDGVWLAVDGDKVVGSVFIDGVEADTKGAHLRWYIVSDDCRGRGIGKILLRNAMDFCRQVGYRSVYLWTFAGLDAARHLYEGQGFSLAEEREDTSWGETVTAQKFVWKADSAGTAG
jgi:GNAT superfamily N-acetyltransferase